MNTLGVMCIVLHRTNLSVTPLFRMISSMRGVMFWNAILDGISNVRHPVRDFIVRPGVNACR